MWFSSGKFCTCEDRGSLSHHPHAEGDFYSPQNISETWFKNMNNNQTNVKCLCTARPCPEIPKLMWKNIIYTLFKAETFSLASDGSNLFTLGWTVPWMCLVLGCVYVSELKSFSLNEMWRFVWRETDEFWGVVGFRILGWSLRFHRSSSCSFNLWKTLSPPAGSFRVGASQHWNARTQVCVTDYIFKATSDELAGLFSRWCRLGLSRRRSSPAEKELSTDQFWQSNYLQRRGVTGAFNCLSWGHKRCLSTGWMWTF